jgi:two-component system, cell cycle sensor histidine kinase and response regulator CckA
VTGVEQISSDAEVPRLLALMSDSASVEGGPGSDLYRDIVESLNTDIALFDCNGRYRYVNKGAVKDPLVRQWLVGKTNVEYAEWRGQPIEAARRRDEIISGVISTGRPTTFEETLIGPDGTASTFVRKLAPIVDANNVVKGAVGYGINITSKVEAARALAESEERFRSIVEQSPLGIFRTRVSDRQLLLVNQSLVDMLGFDSIEELLAVDLGKAVYANPQDRDELLRRYGENGSSKVRTNWVKKDGTPIIVEISFVRVRSPDGSQEYWEGFVDDVTKIVDSERALRESEERLQQAQKMEAIGRLAGGIAHDFNNLLTVIRVHGEFLSRDGGTDAEKSEDSREILKAVDRAEGLTKQLLAFGRKQILQPKVLNLNHIVDDVLQMLKRVLTANVMVQTRLNPKVGKIRADPGQISQVLINLIVNARDAMPSGGTISIATSEVELTPSQAHNYGVESTCFVRLAIRDTGMGMDDQTRSRLFEPFFTTKELGRGTGLGLSTVYGIVQQSGGFITVDSKLNEGSEFAVYLPGLGDAKTATQEMAVPSLRVSTGNETILLVEDDEPVRQLAARVLSRSGYNVLQAHDGLVALDVAEGYPAKIDLLLTDVMMPEMGGVELAEQLTRKRPETRLMFMSGYARDGSPLPGNTDQEIFLQKPFTSQSLNGCVREALQSQLPTLSPGPRSQ